MGKMGLDGWGPGPRKKTRKTRCAAEILGADLYTQPFLKICWTVLAKVSLKLLSSGRATAVVRSSPKKD